MGAFRPRVEQLETRNAPGAVLDLLAFSLFGPGLGLGLMDGGFAVTPRGVENEQESVSLLSATNSRAPAGDSGFTAFTPSLSASWTAAPVVAAPAPTASWQATILLNSADAEAVAPNDFDSGEWTLEQKQEVQRSRRGWFDLEGNAIADEALYGDSFTAGVRGTAGGLHAVFGISSDGSDPTQLLRTLQLFVTGRFGGNGGGSITAAPTIRILADTDRNAIVDDNDEADKATWTRDRGSIFMVNFDDDDGNRQPDAVSFNDQGRPLGENFVIENDADLYDIAPVVIKGLGPEFNPGSMTVYLATGSKEDAQSIHVFPALTPGTSSILGDLGDRVVGGAPALELADITAFVSQDSDTYFGVEGLVFRNPTGALPLRFDGTVDLYLVVYEGENLLGYDQVQLKVAPWLMLPHTQQSLEIWSADYGTSNAQYHFNASAAAGYYGLDDSGQLQLITGADRGTQWVQDHAETGYTQMPGSYAQQSHFRLPYFRGGPANPTWGINRMLRPDVGAFQLGVSLGASSGDYGGNVEILPPTATHPLGRIIFGDTGSTTLRNFFTAQEVQPPVSIPTRWLAVGHADETIGFTQSGQLVMGSTSKAYELMEAIPVADRGKSVFYATGRPPETGTAGAGSTATRLMVPGVNYTGTTWQYLRLYSGAAAGQVARITGRGNGYLDVSTVWNTTSTIVGATSADPSHYRWLYAANAPSRAGWWTTPVSGNQFALVEGTRTWSGGTPSIITVQEMLADPGFRDLNLNYVAQKEAVIRSTLENAAGGKGSLEIVEVPVLFVGRRSGFDTSRASVAYTAGLENFHPLGDSLYMPRQYSVKDSAGNDLFETYTSSALPNAKFVEDWDLYHRLLGEVHCGSVVMREPYAYDWWGSQP